jgi:hypothetical protein
MELIRWKDTRENLRREQEKRCAEILRERKHFEAKRQRSLKKRSAVNRGQ